MAEDVALRAPETWRGAAAQAYDRWSGYEARAAAELDAALRRAEAEIARAGPGLAERLAAIELPAAVAPGAPPAPAPRAPAPRTPSAVARDRDNRARLAADLQRLRSGGRTFAAHRRLLATAESAAGRLAELDRTVDPITGASVPVHLLTYDPHAFRGDGAVVVAIGDLAAADHVGVLVPGMGTTAASLGAVGGGAAQLYAAARRADPGAAVATVAWIGYDAPSGRGALAQVSTTRSAERGAALLRDDLAALGRLSPAGSRTVVFGHSYGSTTAAIAGRGGALSGTVDAMVLFGSPGTGPVHRAAELGLAEGVYVARDPDDPVPPGTFLARALGVALGAAPGLTGFGVGNDPAAESFGAKAITVEGPTGPRGAHSGYLDPGSPALAEFGRVLAGRSGDAG
ncbi:alpha/beta hydrolase [Tsukamurella strandjordii]|uniref:alpha/beta hydrolase n=1 Tax=Tsukamurella strandjordii TaxID=147577 RepID=UPI0031DAE91F